MPKPATWIVLLPLLGTACNPAASDGDGETSETNGDTGDTGDGDGDEEPEIPGEPLSQHKWCPDVTVDGLQRFPGASLRGFGPCGDALVSQQGEIMLLRVDGEPEMLGVEQPDVSEPPNSYALSPRGRLLAIVENNTTLTVRNLETDVEASVPLVIYSPSPRAVIGSFGFVISKSAPGVRVWTCNDHSLDLLIDDQPVRLADEVNCVTIATSGMQSQLVFATMDNTVMWADTDAQTVVPTLLPDFKHEGLFWKLGERKDVLGMTRVGPHLVHSRWEVQDNDGRDQPLPQDTSVYDLEHHVVLATDTWGISAHQAPAFGAPLFIVHHGALYGVVDGTMLQLAMDINPWHMRPTADGSLLTIEGGEVVRFSGPTFTVRETLLDAPPTNWTLTLAPSAESGAAAGATDICATPACNDTLSSLRRFNLDGSVGQPVLSARNWYIFHVTDDGMILARGAPVDGPFDSNVQLPEERVVLIGQDAAILAEYGYDPDASVGDFGMPLADGRMLLAITNYQSTDELIVVDSAAGTIEPAVGYENQTGEWPIHQVDALGRRVVIAYQHEFVGASVVWGEVP
jgi:hypothetical protein